MGRGQPLAAADNFGLRDRTLRARVRMVAAVHTCRVRWYPVSMTKKSKPRSGSKAAFVRANPTASAREIVELGAKQGISLTVGHVYNIRAEDKRKRGQAASGQSPAAASQSAREASQLEAQLRTLVIRIGLDRAERVFSELKSTLARMA